jgi:dual specificity MAP kinase phosphatase
MYVIRSWLYVGKFRETQDEELLKQCGIRAILQLADSVKQPKILSLYVPVEDGELLPFEQLKRGVEFVRLAKAQNSNVLIACGAGISRSASFAIAALKEEEKLTLLDAFRQVLAKHPQARPHPALWKSLCEYYDEDVGYKDILKLLRQLNSS